jgi:hypothetical protein
MSVVKERESEFDQDTFHYRSNNNTNNDIKAPQHLSSTSMIQETLKDLLIKDPGLLIPVLPAKLSLNKFKSQDVSKSAEK